MRITGGQHRGRVLNTPGATKQIRPTSDKVRQAVFNMLEARGLIEDAYVLDAFCGTGALGLEALSRGAVQCVFLDKSARSLSLAKENAVMLGLEDQADFLKADTLKVTERPQKYMPRTLIFLDPPYHQDMVPGALEALTAQGWIGSEAVCVIETDKSERLSLEGFEILQDKIYGDTRILIADS